ncbi:MAG: hypothetical protein U0L05_01395 [Schaedlerella sp.]|nr:hypothetical protein [Schaedlerella sp.]
MGVRKPTQIGFIPKKKSKKPTPKETREKLIELGIEFDENAKLEELLQLLPKE